jgi:hypothetical protein
VVLAIAMAAGILAYSASAASTASAGGSTSGAVYVALGDSYAAGEGLGGFEAGTNSAPSNSDPAKNTNAQKNTCRRSASKGYGSLGATFVLKEIPASSRAHWACSGAWSTDLLRNPGQLPITDGGYQYNQPKQTDMVSSNTRYVTVSAGGNDIGFGDLGKACAGVRYPSGSTAGLSGAAPCADQLVSSRTRLRNSAPNLAAVYRAILDRAPNAIVAVVGYPKVFPGPSDSYANARQTVDGQGFCATNTIAIDPTNNVYAYVGATVENAKAIDQIVRDLNGTVQNAVQVVRNESASYASRLLFVDTYSAAVPHNCSGSTPGVSVNGVMVSGFNGTGPLKAISTATFHPTTAGQRSMGARINAAFAPYRLGYSAGRVDIKVPPNAPFSRTIPFTGGLAPFAALAVSSNYPSWLTIAIAGNSVVLGGTPSAPGTWSVTISLTDSKFGSAGIPVRVTVGLDAAQLEGQIIRRSDGVSWVVRGGQRYHIPNYATDLCAVYVERREVAYAGLTDAAARTIPEAPTKHVCGLDKSILRALNRPDPKPSYAYASGKRFWIPDQWTFGYLIKSGYRLVDIATETEILRLTDGGTHPARLDPAAVPRNSIVRRSDGVSWVVDSSGVRHHIPFVQDDVCWRLLRGLPVSATGLSGGQVGELPEADAWPCVIGPAIVRSDNGAIYFVDGTNTRRWIQDWETYTTLLRTYRDVGTWPAGDVTKIPEGAWMPKMINPANVANTLICAANGNCYAVDGAGTRHWIPSYPDFVCWKFVNRWGVSRSGLTDEQTASLPESNAWGCNMSGWMMVTDTGATYYMDGNGTRRWVQDPESYWCYVGRGVPVFRGIPQGEANGIAEGGWMPRCLDPNRVKNRVVRVTDGTAYFIDSSGWWYWIPNGTVWNCITSKYSILISNATWDQVNSIRRERGVAAYCGQ